MNREVKEQILQKIKAYDRIFLFRHIRPDGDCMGATKGLADIKGTDIWVNFTETEEGVLCELRSGGVNINPIAVKYGGGGHAKASGATVPNRETAMQMLADLNELAGE